MTEINLIPQNFGNAVTQLPAINFFNTAKSLLPQVYQNAPNFMALIQTISENKQYIYDVIRSLVNVMNLNDSGNPSTEDVAVPAGVYAQILASIFTAPYTQGDADDVIINSIENTVGFVNSRGLASDFYNYFELNGLDGYFTSTNVTEIGNATVFMVLPLIDAGSPNPYEIFTYDMLKLKGAGIRIIVNLSNVPYFQLSSLPTDSPPLAIASGNASYPYITAIGQILGGGFYPSL